MDATRRRQSHTLSRHRQPRRLPPSTAAARCDFYCWQMPTWRSELQKEREIYSAMLQQLEGGQAGKRQQRQQREEKEEVAAAAELSRPAGQLSAGSLSMPWDLQAAAAVRIAGADGSSARRRRRRLLGRGTRRCWPSRTSPRSCRQRSQCRGASPHSAKTLSQLCRPHSPPLLPPPPLLSARSAKAGRSEGGSSSRGQLSCLCIRRRCWRTRRRTSRTARRRCSS